MSRNWDNLIKNKLKKTTNPVKKIPISNDEIENENK
jgi:hypothetical protein